MGKEPIFRYKKCDIIPEYIRYTTTHNKYHLKYSPKYFGKFDGSFITNMICTEYTNHQYDICKTVTELCELRDGVAHCGVVNRTDICSLLEVLCTD